MSIVNEERKYNVHVKLIPPVANLGNPTPIIQGFLRVGLPEKHCKDFIESIHRVGHFGCPAGQMFLYDSKGVFTTVVGSNVVKDSITQVGVVPQDV